MIDYFALFGLHRRPLIDLESLRELYFRRSEQADRDSQGDLSTINEAFQTLSNPASRLDHLLRLEFGDLPPRVINPAIGTLFGELANAVARFDDAFSKVASQTSPLLRALDIQSAASLQEDLNTLAAVLSEQRTLLMDRLNALNTKWPDHAAETRDALAQIALDLTFIDKWQKQLQERKLRLEELV